MKCWRQNEAAPETKPGTTRREGPGISGDSVSIWAESMTVQFGLKSPDSKRVIRQSGIDQTQKGEEWPDGSSSLFLFRLL